MLPSSKIWNSNHRLLSRWVAGLLTGALLIPLVFSSRSIEKGQPIKQFFSYSLSESISHQPSRLFSTQLPCQPPRAWVEEPPVFHCLAAIFVPWGVGSSFLLPWLAFIALGLGLSQWLGLRIGLAVLMTPIFFRYSIQHLPDLLATAALIWGCFAFHKGRTRWGTFFWCLASTTKFLTIFAIVPLLFHFAMRRSKSLSSTLGSLALIVLPFGAWVVWIFVSHIPSPFSFAQGWNNRHSGSLALLWNPMYWLRFQTWLGIKGAGAVYWIAALMYFAIWISRRSYARMRSLSDLESCAIVWALAAIPYWILVRDGNWVHDYYSLPFVTPFAVLGVLHIQKIKRAWLRRGLFAAQALIAVASLASLKPVGTPAGLDRPTFCDMEQNTGSDALHHSP